MVVRAVDREYWNALTGNYFLCGLAYSGTTSEYIASERALQNQVGTVSKKLWSFWIYNNDYMNFELTAGELRNNDLNVVVDFGVYESQGAAASNRNIQLLYQLCTSNDC
jgi:hypothetical protein